MRFVNLFYFLFFKILLLIYCDQLKRNVQLKLKNNLPNNIENLNILNLNESNSNKTFDLKKLSLFRFQLESNKKKVDNVIFFKRKKRQNYQLHNQNNQINCNVKNKKLLDKYKCDNNDDNDEDDNDEDNDDDDYENKYEIDNDDDDDNDENENDYNNEIKSLMQFLESNPKIFETNPLTDSFSSFSPKSSVFSQQTKKWKISKLKQLLKFGLQEKNHRKKKRRKKQKKLKRFKRAFGKLDYLLPENFGFF